jgi:L-threonylcarbamoyladenylate synthase
MRENIWNDDNLVRTLKNDGIVVMPTDTIYGIVGRAESPEVVERIYKLRKRAPEKPCIILIADIEEVRKFKIELTEKQTRVVKEYWPGPISIIFDCSHPEHEYLHRGTKTLAFRVPSCLELRQLLEATGPLIAPSANTEGREPSRNVEDAESYFGSTVSMYVDGGNILSKPSLVIRLLSDGSSRIIRA